MSRPIAMIVWPVRRNRDTPPGPTLSPMVW